MLNEGWSSGRRSNGTRRTDDIDEVRAGIERDVKHDLDHLRIVVSGSSSGMEVGFADVAAFLHELDREAHGRIRLRMEAPFRFTHSSLRPAM